MTNLQQCFSLFYGHDELRPKFYNPLIWNDKVYATDAYTLIYVDKKNIDFEFTNEYESPNLSTILPQINISELLLIPDLEQYKTADELKPDGKDIVCMECNGEGEVEWEYERWTKYFDCPKCDGDGYESEAKMIPTGNKTFRDIKIKIKDTYLDIFKFNKLLQVQSLIGGNIELVSYVDKKIFMFKIGICHIVIMPLRDDVYDEILIIKTE